MAARETIINGWLDSAVAKLDAMAVLRCSLVTETLRHSSLDSPLTTMDWSWNTGLYRVGLQDGEQRR